LQRKKRQRAFVARRSRCGECRRLVPSDSVLACKVMAITGDGRTLIGRLKRQAVGGRVRLLAVPQVVCTYDCAVAALRRQIAALRQAAD